MPPLSVVIITYNEEKNLHRCLDSVKDIADEIVIVDSYSKDNTEKIALSYGARFIQHPFEGHIEQKNWAITKARYPHILSLDADEELSSRLQKSILEIKNNWQADGYYFNRLTNYCGKWINHTSWYPARKLRLWDSRKGKWGGINPHDRFILDKGSSKKFLKGDLLHYSYYSISEHISQIDTFSTIVAKAYFKEGRTANYFNIIVHPVWRLFRDYIIKLGFLDGFYGLVVSVNSAHETFLKYVKLKNLHADYARAVRTRICFFNSAISWGGGEKWHYDVSTRLRAKNYDILLMSHPHSELSRRIRKTNVPYHSIRATNLSFLNPFKLVKLFLIFKKERVETIIINLSSDLKVAGTAAKLAGVKNIIYRRGSAIAIRNTILNRFLFRNVITRLIANSEETQRTILQNNPSLIPREKIHIIYNGIDLEQFDNMPFKKIFEKESGEIIIGNAGRLSEEKGQNYLIDLAARLKEKGYRFKVLIAGKGKLKSRLVKYAKLKAVEDNVIFLGFVDNIKNFNCSIDIFILSSLYEGFGYVLVEAMAAKKPIVAFDIKSSSEIVDDQKSGFLVERENLQQLLVKTEELINNPELRNSFGDNGRKKVEKEFTFNKSLDEIEDLLKKEQPNAYLQPPGLFSDQIIESTI